MARFDIDTLIEETLGELVGYSVDQGQLTWLTDAIDEIQTTLSINDPGANGVHRGIAEVGEELVFVASTSNSVATLAPFGRGYQGSTPAAWPAETRVTFGPRFPRHWVRNAINDIIRGVWPMLFAVGETDITPNPVQTTYELPADIEGDYGVLNVKQATFGPSGLWRTLDRYRVNHEAETATGKSIDILEPIDVLTIRVTYQTRPVELVSGDTWIDSGLAESAWPGIKHGALYQLIGPQASGSSGVNSVKAAEAQRRRGSKPVDLAQYHYALSQQLLAEERTRLLNDVEINSPREEF